MPNAELAYGVLDQIHANPNLWDQRDWFTRPPGNDCGTAGCFAGWACLLSGDKPLWQLGGQLGAALESAEWVTTPDGVVASAMMRAAQLLAIDPCAADHLFAASNTLDDLDRYVGEFFGPRPTVSAA